MAKKKVRGIDCKLWFKKATADGGIIIAQPSKTAPPTAADFDEVKSVNNVEQSLQSNTYAFETREQEDDETIPVGRTRDLTITIYEDAGDEFYVRLWTASRSDVQSEKVVGLAYSNCDLAVVPILGTVGNFSVTQEDWSEQKKEGKLVKFKLSVGTFVTDFKKLVA